MTKTFCDRCKREALDLCKPTGDRPRHFLDAKDQDGKLYRFVLEIGVSHTPGDSEGDTPDLCLECVLALIYHNHPLAAAIAADSDKARS